MNVLILGGSGFLGLHVTAALHAAGHGVHWLNRGKTPVPPGFGAPVLIADRDDRAAVEVAVRRGRFDAIVDLSGYRTEHVEPVLAALEDRPAHYVFCSSVAVYRHPLHEYGRDKLGCELLLAERAAAATVLRLAPAFGAWDYKCRELFYLRRILAGEPVALPDAGRYQIHLLDAAHFAGVVAGLLGDPRSFGGVYNVATGDPVSLSHYVRLIGAAAGRQVRLVPLGRAEGRERFGPDYRRNFPHAKPYHQAYAVGALRRLVAEPGDLAAGIGAAVRWYTEIGEERLLERVRAQEAVYAAEVGLYHPDRDVVLS